MERNRSEGWKHAKISGHDNEEILKKLLLSDNAYAQTFIHKFKKNSIKTISASGLKEHGIESVLNDSTKAKADISIEWNDDKKTLISIKKSRSGQVFLIKTSRFIDGFEKQYNRSISKDVKKALMLFFGEDEETIKIINNRDSHKNKQYELRKSRLTFESLTLYNLELANLLILWLKENIMEITDYCFAKGLVKNKDNWAEFIWYKNLIGEDDFDEIIQIEKLSKKCYENKQFIEPGKQGGGTTIQLPFGFVQWHQSSMQFHHNYEKIISIMNKSDIYN